MRILILLLVLLASSVTAQESYNEVSIEGWPVKMSRSITPKRAAQARELLTQKLRDIRGVLPRQALRRLLKIPIWVDAKAYDLHGLRFNPSAQWLREHGQDPRLANGVQICNVDDFLSWKDQPWFVLHELAHAYQFNVLGDTNPQVLAAFRNAQQKGLYQQVKRNNGRVERAYALNNEREYFAELSEAYFGVNDFFPFDRKDLATYDRVVFAMMEKCWR